MALSSSILEGAAALLRSSGTDGHDQEGEEGDLDGAGGESVYVFMCVPVCMIECSIRRVDVAEQQAFKHIYAHAHIRTCTHTHTRAHTHTVPLSCGPVRV